MRRDVCKGKTIAWLCAVALLLSFSATAGTVDVGVRIIGGEPVPEGRYPFLVSLQQEGQHWCTATLIGPDQVLTARHCTHPSTIPRLTAVIGRAQLSAPGGEERRIVDVHNHPDLLDVSVLTLDAPVYTIEPVALAASGVDPAGTDGIATGWGSTDNDGTKPDWLQRVSVPILSKQECAVIHDDWFVPEGEVCAGSPGAGACYGDSGGPLLQDVEGTLVQVGVVSRGRDAICAQDPGGQVFTDTASELFRTWLGVAGSGEAFVGRLGGH
jgi:secreted trypsin-like serine protease